MLLWRACHLLKGIIKWNIVQCLLHNDLNVHANVSHPSQIQNIFGSMRYASKYFQLIHKGILVRPITTQENSNYCKCVSVSISGIKKTLEKVYLIRVPICYLCILLLLCGSSPVLTKGPRGPIIVQLSSGSTSCLLLHVGPAACSLLPISLIASRCVLLGTSPQWTLPPVNPTLGD